MVERVEDLLLPNAVVQRIMKDAIPDGINIAKEARNEISRAASIFILYLTSTASLNTKSRNQKTMNTQDILDALGTIEMENFIDPLKEALALHIAQKAQRTNKQPASSNNDGEEASAEDPVEEVMETEEEILATIEE